MDVFASTIQTVLMFAAWIIFSLSGHVIGKKLQHSAPWLAWVPILNLFYFASVAGRSPWLGLALFVPFVNIIVYAVIFGDIADRLSLPKWLGWCMLIPVANVFIMPYLAASGTAISKPRPGHEPAFDRAPARTS
jgi:ABC-type transport system involved in cytochrome c biogenesis permease subunit